MFKSRYFAARYFASGFLARAGAAIVVNARRYSQPMLKTLNRMMR